MKVAIDVGCWPGGFDSISYLIDELKVDKLIGFDPHPETPIYKGNKIKGAKVWTYRSAAHTRDGFIGWRQSGWGSYTTGEESAPQVPMVDFAAFLKKLIESAEDTDREIEWLAVKLDIEGDEFPLLRHLIDTGVINVIDLLWVEWHGNDGSRKALTEWIEQHTKCELHEWTL